VEIPPWGWPQAAMTSSSATDFPFEKKRFVIIIV